MSKRLIRSPCVGLVTAVLWAMMLGACKSGPVVRLADGILYVPAGQPFAISLVPSVPVPIRLGTNLGFNVSSSTAGYYSLYLIDPVGEVWVLAENMPLPAGSVTYPSPPAQNFTLAAAEPLGVNRVILLVTRDPFGGFSGNATMTRAVSLAIRGGAFVSQLNAVLATLPTSDWATDEITVRVVA